jgi:hypothetical protein
MRFNKTIFVLLSGATLSLTLGFPPVLAREQNSVSIVSHSAVSHTLVSRSDKNNNEGRKLSMTLPGIGTAVVTVTPAATKPLNLGKPLAPGRKVVLGLPTFDKKNLSFETRGNNITVRVPPSVDAVIDDAQVVTRHLGKMAANGAAGAGRLVNMLVLYFKQWTGTTTITPGGYPYVEKSSHALYQPPTTIASGHKLYFTGEGRLKSVVSR